MLFLPCWLRPDLCSGHPMTTIAEQTLLLFLALQDLSCLPFPRPSTADPAFFQAPGVHLHHSALTASCGFVI